MILGRSLMWGFLTCFTVSMTFQLRQNIFNFHNLESCPKNMHYSSCSANPLCQRSCANNNKPLHCPHSCTKGCICDKDFVLGYNKECIPISRCPEMNDIGSMIAIWNGMNKEDKSSFEETTPISLESWTSSEEPEDLNPEIECPKGEHFEPCGEHFSCQKNCTIYDKNISCTHSCVPGCICDLGLIRKSNPFGRCIKPERCPNSILSKPEIREEPHGCPDEEFCSKQCVKHGRRYGTCAGPKHRECICY